VKTVTRDDIDRFMHNIAAGITAGRQKTKPRGVSVVRGGRRQFHLCRAPLPPARQPGAWRRQVCRTATARRMPYDEYRQLGKALSMAVHGDVWKVGDRCNVADDPDRVATQGVLGLRWSEIDLLRRKRPTDRHQDRRIAPPPPRHRRERLSRLL
jgi:hypothetical protein